MILWISGGKGISFSTQKIGRKMVLPYYLQNLYDVMGNEKNDLSVIKKRLRLYIFLVWTTMFAGYCKVLVLKFLEMENLVFF